MKILTFLLLLSLIQMYPMCSGATLECDEEEVHSEYVDSGSFIYQFQAPISGKDYFRIEIMTHGVLREKTVKANQTKAITVDGNEMWETSPVYIASASQVTVYFASCEYVY